MPLERGVRIRGIFATAIARLLIDNGIKIVDASPQLKERFGDEAKDRGVALVTIKDRDDRKGLVVIGQRRLAEDVLRILRSTIVGSPIIVMEEELYATYVCRVVEPNIVELPDGRVGVLEGSAKVGELVAAHVVTFRDGKPLLRRGVALVGEYARLVEGQPHDVSEHIRGLQRNLLLSMAMQAGVEGWGVKWRSSARWAEIGELLDELKALKEAALRVKDVVRKASQPAKLTDGELLAFIPLSLDDKVRLDHIRSRQVPTIPLHHLLKTCGDRYSNLVDEAEKTLLRHGKPDQLSKALLEEVATREFASGRFRVLHEKIDGKVVVMEGECEVIFRRPLTVELRRRARGSGVYDGLGIAKEEGDVIVSIVTLGSYTLPHAYFSYDGNLKGVYVNINTPIEPLPSHSVWYVDLCVDVVWARGEGARIIDLEELKKHSECLSEEAISFYEELTAGVARRLNELEGEPDDRVVKALTELSRSFISDSLAQVLSAEDV